MQRRHVPCVVGRGDKRLVYDPGSELRLRGKRKKGEDGKRDGKKEETHPHKY